MYWNHKLGLFHWWSQLEWMQWQMKPLVSCVPVTDNKKHQSKQCDKNYGVTWNLNFANQMIQNHDVLPIVKPKIFLHSSCLWLSRIPPMNPLQNTPRVLRQKCMVSGRFQIVPTWHRYCVNGVLIIITVHEVKGV